jgi:hypothetical protein
LSFRQYVTLKAAALALQHMNSIFGYVWIFLIYTGQGMELTDQFVTAETNKTAATVLKLSEKLSGCGHTVCMDNFYNSEELARFDLCMLT